MRVAVLLLLVLPGLARALTWPGSAPCHTTLQACIDAAAPGATIEIATPGPVDEDLTLAKSVVLAAAAGVAPVLGGGVPRLLTVVDAGPGGGAVAVQVRGLALVNARLRVELDAASGHEVTVAGVGVTHALAGEDGIHLDLRVPATVLVRDTAIAAPGDALAVHAAPVAGAVAVTALANRIGPGSAAGASRTGILAALGGGGSATVTLQNNVVQGVAGCGCPDAAGVLVRAGEAVAGTVHVTNNTIDGAAGDGLRVLTPGGTAAVALAVFNNLVTGSGDSGIVLPPLASPALSVENGHNDFHASGGFEVFGGYAVGPATLAVNPFYRDGAGGDLRLSDLSPVRDVGRNDPPGGLPAADADGRPRVVGSAVDLGAYEHDGLPSTTTTTTTVPGGTTTTTLPVIGCPPAASYPSVVCRLDALGAVLADGLPPGRWAIRLGRAVARATAEARAAQALDLERRTEETGAALGRAQRHMARVVRALGARRVRRALGAPLAEAVRATARRLRADLRALRGVSVAG